MRDSTKIVIVGLGLVGRRHADAIEQVAGAQLVGVVDTSESARACAQEYGVACVNDLATAFETWTPDGIILSTPTPLHVEQGKLCVEHGCAVLIEKPLATSATEAVDLVAGAAKRDVPILVGHHRRYNPLIQKARALIDEGEVGEIRSVHAQC